MIRFLVTLLGLVLSLSSMPAFAACSSPSGNEGSVIYSASAKQLQFCNGTSWVNTGATVQSVGGGGGGAPTYLGLSAAGKTGDAGGTFALDQACASTFSGARAMRTSDIKYVVSDILADTVNFGGNRTALVVNDGTGSDGACNYHTSTSGSARTILMKSGSNFSVRAEISGCSISYQVVCVSD